MAHHIVGHVIAADKRALHAADVAVLIVLAWHANATTWKCWPGNDLLAAETGLTYRGVQKSLTHLETLEWVSITYQAKPRRRIIDLSRANAVHELCSCQDEQSSELHEHSSSLHEQGSPEPVRNQEENQEQNPSRAQSAHGSALVTDTRGNTSEPRGVVTWDAWNRQPGGKR